MLAVATFVDDEYLPSQDIPVQRAMGTSRLNGQFAGSTAPLCVDGQKRLYVVDTNSTTYPAGSYVSVFDGLTYSISGGSYTPSAVIRIDP